MQAPQKKQLAEPWRLISQWVSVEFAAGDEGQKEEWVCLVVNWDEATGRHLVRWVETNEEEWVPAFKEGEFKPIASLKEKKTEPVRAGTSPTVASKKSDRIFLGIWYNAACRPGGTAYCDVIIRAHP